ncbi:RRP15-like protein [Scyliorhinus canicula]|uniref:RRP15-like protein n=1 Tax=Scyliorhinus canicula TaxID=7830 RepID=UPI0018F42B58|nr:RRP15-like protein [Scyliorhinus canicula]
MALQVGAVSRVDGGGAEAEFSDSDGDLGSDRFSSCEDEKNHAPEAELEGETADPNPTNSNAGWADAMAKILRKRIPENKPAILAKTKEKLKEKRRQVMLEKTRQLDKRKEWEQIGRVKPDVIRDREAERNFQKIATRGVVQLFNAVRKHQTSVDEKIKEVGGSERKRAKLMSSVSKKDFINVLRESGQYVHQNSAERTAIGGKRVEVKSEDSATWNILRDDFMMGAAMKDWDKESDMEEETKPLGGVEESDSDR